MSDHSFDLDHLAKLAELELDDAKKAALREDLDAIFGHIETLQEVDVEGVDPSAHAEELLAPLRPDEMRPSQSQEAALGNAPHANAGQFVVPRVVGEE